MIHLCLQIVRTLGSFHSPSCFLVLYCLKNSAMAATYTMARVAWSVVTLEKWFSSMVRVPVSATWPQPQNSATPEKQRMVATSEAQGTPPRHLMQHSKHPAKKGDSDRRRVNPLIQRQPALCENKLQTKMKRNQSRLQQNDTSQRSSGASDDDTRCNASGPLLFPSFCAENLRGRSLRQVENDISPCQACCAANRSVVHSQCAFTQSSAGSAEYYMETALHALILLQKTTLSPFSSLK